MQLFASEYHRKLPEKTKQRTEARRKRKKEAAKEKTRRGRRSSAGTGPKDSDSDLTYTRQQWFPHRPHRRFPVTAPASSLSLCGVEGGNCRDVTSWKVGRRGAAMHSVCFSAVRGGARVPFSRRWPTRRHGKSNHGSMLQNGTIKGQSSRHTPGPLPFLREWFPRDNGVFETSQARAQLILKRRVVGHKLLCSNLFRDSG